MSRWKREHEFGMEGSEGELNLVPYLDIMVNLVMFLLFTFQVIVDMNVIDLVSPAYGAASASAANPNPETKVRTITLVISPSGYTLLSSDEEMPKIEVPLKSDGKFDYDQLRVKAAEWKDTYELGTSLILTADKTTEYREVIAAMDAIRQDGDRELFPDVLLAANSAGGAPTP